MVSPDIAKKIKQLEIYTRRLLTSTLVGDSRSAVKGSGFEFDQIRDYTLGDDIRFIDWHASARMNKLLVKQYMQERSRTIYLLVDFSSSRMFGSSGILRHEIIAQIASVLSLVSAYAKDQVGLILFTNEVECVIPPNKGMQHVRRIMEKLFTYKTAHTTTSIKTALDYMLHVPSRDALVFVISDFIDEGFERSLRLIGKKHDCVAIRCLDTYEQQMPSVGFLMLEDSETGTNHMIDARDARQMSEQLQQRICEQNKLFTACGVDRIDITMHKPFIGELIRFFRYRMVN